MGERQFLGVRLVRFRADASLAGSRLSRCVAEAVGGLSVRAAKDLVDRGRVFVDDERVLKASIAVRPGARVVVCLDLDPPTGRPVLGPEQILWEGPGLVAVNKPPGLAVHGTHGATAETLLPRLERLLGGPLALVHRLDRDTSGVILVARDERAARDLEGQFRGRKVLKRYRALVRGIPREGRFRRESTVRAKRPRAGGGSRGPAGKGRKGAAPAEASAPRGVTEFALLERFPRHRCALLEARPLTGRTHQVRVHLAQLGHPVLGDALYGPARCEGDFLKAVPRQMLHAEAIGFLEPGTSWWVELHAPLPPDMERVLDWLEAQGPGVPDHRDHQN